MRSALQMLGGVAVAGAVAAGSTAFTGAGLDATGITTVFAGGTASVSVTGATVSAVKLVQSSGTALTTIDVSLSTASFNTGKTMTLAVTGGTPANGSDKFVCAYNAGNGTANTYECAPKLADGTTASTFNPTGVTAVAITLI